MRHVRPVSADDRQPGTHGQRHGRARHADPGPGRRRGRHRTRAGRPVQPRHRRRSGRAGHVLRPVHPDDHPQPLRRGAGHVPRPVQQRLYLPAQVARGRLAVHRPDAAGPLHRGHLPDLRLRGRARRPVRQLRQPARPRRPDQPAVEDQRRDAGLRRDRAVLPRPAGVRRRARQLAAEQERPVAAERAEVHASTCSASCSRGPSPGTWTGACRSRSTAGGTCRTSGSTSGSTRSSATCRRRSSGRGAAAIRTPGAPGGRRRTPSPTTSWARTTSSSTPRSGRPCCWATTARVPGAASPASSASSTCRRKSSPASS